MKRNKPDTTAAAAGPSRRAMATQFRMEQGENGQRRMTGHGSVFNTPSQDLGGFREIIHPGAFDAALATADVRCLFNHDPNLILGRTASGTLRVTTDPTGLAYDCDAPDTTYAADLAISMERGDVTQSSFAFLLDWTDEGTQAEGGSYEWEYRSATNEWFLHIYRVAELLDVSPVTYPAYLEADAQNARSHFRGMIEQRNAAQISREQAEAAQRQAAAEQQQAIIDEAAQARARRIRLAQLER